MNHLCQQARCRNAFVDDLGCHGCGHDGLAAGTGVFAANVAVHKELRWHTVKLLADFFANALQSMAQRAHGRFNLVVVLDTLQLSGQWLALGLAFDCCRLAGLVGSPVFGLELLDQRLLNLDIKELDLGAVHAFARRAKAPLLQAHHLQIQGLIFGLFKLELCAQSFDELAGVLRS